MEWRCGGACSPFVAAFALAAPACAQEIYVIDPGHTMPAFEVRYAGFSVQRGTFAKMTGRVTLDAAAKKGSIELTIDTRSISTGEARRDEALKGENFFNVGSYPTMVYKASDLVFDGDAVVGASGELTLLGVTRPVAITVTGFRCGRNPLDRRIVCGAEVAAAIRRSEWGMTFGMPEVANEVKIAMPIEAFRE